MPHPIKHFETITNHRHEVARLCMKAGIPLQGVMHDLSKYSPSEFIPGALYYRGFQSPNVDERIDKGYSKAWLHHKGRNKHHFEYWNDYNMTTHKSEPVKMPLRYVIEMFCDRVAAGKTYLGDKYTQNSPLLYFEKGSDTRRMDPETSALLEKLLTMLSTQGEDKTFAYIRKLLYINKKY
jgi:hypothetical protein